MASFLLVTVIFIRYRPHFNCITFKGYEDLGKLSSENLLNLEHRIRGIQASCGQICDTSLEAESKLPMIHGTFKKSIQCRDLFENDDIDRTADINFPPYEIPDFLFPYYTYQGRVPVRRFYFGESPETGHTLFWSKTYIEKLQKAKDDGSYGYGEAQKIREQLEPATGGRFPVRGLRVLVIGTEYPWIEAMLLEHGAAHVTTLDYVQITTTHPNITTIIPRDLSEKYLRGQVELYDAVISFSSIEHSGLGRYGDDLNPWGDLITMARAWCLLKENGLALIGVPCAKDRLLFNANRVYGKVQLPHLFANFHIVYEEASIEELSRAEKLTQPLFLLKKVSN